MIASVDIVPLDAEAARLARERQAQLLKPPGSLGRLEDLAIWMAAATGESSPMPRAEIVIAAADHGVAGEGVSAYPSDVTGQMLGALKSGGSAIAALAAAQQVPVLVVDAGVASIPEQLDPGTIVRTGLQPSRNLARQAALTDDEVERAMGVGRRLATEVRNRGSNLLVGGDMGIGNTTPATCLSAWVTGRDGRGLCGRGTGIDDAGLQRKREVVSRAVRLHGETRDPVEALRRMGGGEIAVLCGLALGAGENGLGYLCDGVIATAAAAIAVAIAPGLRSRLLAGHRSPEPAHTALLEHLGLVPVLDLGMRLGEASGAAVALSVLRAGCVAHANMATFAEAGVSGPGQ